MLDTLKKTFFSKFLDIRLKTSRDLETRILERPGRWMSAEQLSSLRNDLVTIASKTLDRGTLTYGVFKEDGSGLENAVITLISEKASGRPIAFNALSVMDVEHGGEAVTVLHLGLVMVDPGVRSRGLSWILYGLTCVLFFMRNQLRPIWISNVTQVPAIVGMVAETFSDVYPQPAGRNRRSIKHLLLAREIMLNHRHVFGVGDDAQFDENRFIIKNAYTGGSDELKKTFDHAPKHRDNIYNAFCAAELNYDRGDDVIQLGQINLKTTKDYLLKSVPRGSFLSIIAAGVLVVIQRLALPVLHWFDSSRNWGRLRAREAR